MSREQEIVNLFLANAPLVALLTGGIYTAEALGIEGIRRGADSPAVNAFDTDGFLKPLAVVREDAISPVPGVRSTKDKITGTSQMIYIYFYQMRGESVVKEAAQRSYSILEGVRLTDSYEMIWMFDTPPFPDMGPVANSTALRQDWSVAGLRRPL